MQYNSNRFDADPTNKQTVLTQGNRTMPPLRIHSRANKICSLSSDMYYDQQIIIYIIRRLFYDNDWLIDWAVFYVPANIV